MGNRKLRRIVEHRQLAIRFFFRRKNPSLKETAILYLPQTGRLAVLPAIRQAHTCKLYSLIAYKFDKPSYCLPMLWQSLHLQATNKNFGLVFFRTQQGMFSAALNELSRFKLDVRRNMARYVLSNSKRFGLLPKTLPHSANFSLRSRENWVSRDKITMLFYVCRHSRLSISN